MCGVLIGAFGVLGLLGLGRLTFGRRHGRWHGRGCHGHGGHGWHGGRHGGPRGLGEERFARAAGEVLKRRLRVDEDQEPVVDHALRDVRAALQELSRELGDTRAGLAEALRGETVDDAAIAAAFARQDDAVQRARREVLSAVKQVHAVLEPEQRGRAADWIAKGSARW